MNPEPAQVESLFAVALGKPTAERAAFLDQACAGNVALRQRVEALLKAHAEASGEAFLAGPCEGVTTAEAPPEGPGTRVGWYKLLQQIGEGGMGVVYMAEQEQPVRRRVALKIIKPGMDSAQVIARFEAERQALALMDHQNIARVLDAGTTPSGRPYFVMELVHGVPLTRFCDDNQLTPRQRLELFIPVCQAIQHAHQKGIIHRDVKPSNVLVTLYDDKPVPKVIDFGVAKAIEQRLTEKTLFTQFGTLVGTFEYMSPEQAEMNAFGVDTRSDVYSLGVLLYELLTGTTPLERERLRRAALDEVVRLIRQEEPPRPSARLSGSGSLPKIAAARRTEPGRLTGLVRGELDWIVMRCLEKDRARRYETASALARDVERYLREEPVEACPPSAAYRLRKFARKNRVVLTTAAALAGILLLATAVGWWLAVRAMQAESWANTRHQEAVAAGQQAVQERDRADEAAKGARSAAAEARRALDRLSVEQGIRLADNDDLFTALLWFAKPLERGGLSPEDERIHRTRFACYLRHTQGRPVLQQMLFHEGTVNQLAFSPDGRQLLTLTEEAAFVWDLDTGQRVATLEQSKGVYQPRFLDGRRAIGLDGTTARTWDTTTGRLLDSRIMDSEPVAQTHLFTLPRSPLQALGSVAVCKLSTVPATSSSDGRLHLRVSGNRAWLSDLATGKLLHSWSLPVLGIFTWDSGFSADAHRVLLSTAKQARVYDTKTGEPVGPALLPGDKIEGARVNSGGSRVVLWSANRVTVWDVITGKQIGPAASVENVVDAAMSPDGRTLALGEHVIESDVALQAQARFWLWDEESGRLITAQANKFQAWPVCFSPDGCNVIATGKDRTDEVWDAQAGRAAGPLLPNHNQDLVAHYGFSPDGSMVAVAHQDGIVRVWHFAGHANGDPVARSQRDGLPPAISYDIYDYHGGIQTFRAMSARSGSRGRLSELRAWLKVLPPSVHDTDMLAAASPDGNRLVTVATGEGLPQGPTALLWDVAAGGLLVGPIKHPANLTHVEFSRDSRFLVTASDPGPARLWDARTGKPIGTPLQHGAGILHAGFSADGSRLVTCAVDGTAQLWDTATATAVGPRLRQADNINAAAFSPDGKRLATASSDGTARIWDVGTGHPIGLALNDGSALSYIAFDAQGRLILTQAPRLPWDTNHGFRIWDAATQQAVSPKLFELGTGFQGVGDRWDADGLSVQDLRGRLYDVKYDLRPYQRPVEDMVKLAQLHAGQRLDDQGGLTLLTTAELHALWNELHAKYPDEFTVSPEAVVAWHVERLSALTAGGSDYADHQKEVRLHRKWLAARMTAANWHEDPKTCSLDSTSSSLYRLQAAAQFGQAQGAVATVEALASGDSLDNGALYECGRIYALAASAVQGDAAVADRYAARAVVLLRQAADAGYKDSQALRIDPDLDALRGRDDFKKLLKERLPSRD
jgi:serine/threonine protein kinase/WD40 repeat protein